MPQSGSVNCVELCSLTLRSTGRAGTCLFVGASQRGAPVTFNVSVVNALELWKASVPIRGVFFDYDGVLTTDKTGSLTTCRHLSSRTGIELNVLANVLQSFNPDLSVGKRSYTGKLQLLYLQ